MKSTYQNPLILKEQWSENELGDPFIYRFDGRYYLYCSSAGNYIKCFESEDLINYTYVGSVCDDEIISGAYAPEITYYQGSFYMVTSPMGSGHYLLKADSPKGPFRIISKNFGQMIDGSFFINDDGEEYLLRAGHNGIICHQINDGEQVDINGTLIKEAYLNYWTEGPMIVKRNGYYFLTYTGNHLLSRGYRIAYCVSKDSPYKGYCHMKEPLLMLETGDEFHGIGHSSSVLSPDLCGYHIAYHILMHKDGIRKRSMNIDKLFFNGARMYANPVWWEQETPRMPDYCTRGIRELEEISKDGLNIFMVKEHTGESYTAELNLYAGSKEASFYYGITDTPRSCTSSVTSIETLAEASIEASSEVTIEALTEPSTESLPEAIIEALSEAIIEELSEATIEAAERTPDGAGYGCIKFDTAGGCQVTENGHLLYTGRLNKSISLKHLLTVRIAKAGGLINLYVNHIYLCTYKSTSGSGTLGIALKDGQEAGYIGFTNHEEHSGDKWAAKAIPGRMDGIHCMNETDRYLTEENGNSVYLASLKSGNRLVYPVNIKETGEYLAMISLYKPVKSINITFYTDTEQKITYEDSGEASRSAEDGYHLLMGTIYLEKGIRELSIGSDTDVMINYLRFVKKAEPLKGMLIKDGCCVDKNAKILGHKRSKSMITKVWGFTCAENKGMVFFGEEGMTGSVTTEYVIRGLINKNHLNTGDASILFRASKESWFNDQPEKSFYGYGLKVSADKIELTKNMYQEEVLVSYKISSIMNKQAEVIITIENNRITVQLDKECLFHYDDRGQFPYGKVGIAASYEGFGFEELEIMQEGV